MIKPITYKLNYNNKIKLQKKKCMKILNKYLRDIIEIMKKILLNITNYHKKENPESAIKSCLSQTPNVTVITKIFIHGK